MAYISHSPIRDIRIPGVSAALVARSALVAALAAGVVLALSAGTQAPAPAAATVAATKSDRLVAPVAATSASSGYEIDQANRTTTVERGAATPLSADSPFNPAAK